MRSASWAACLSHLSRRRGLLLLPVRETYGTAFRGAPVDPDDDVDDVVAGVEDDAEVAVVGVDVSTPRR